MKKELRKLSSDYLVIIYAGLSKKKSVQEIHKELYNRTINSKEFKSELLLKRAEKYTEILERKTKNETGLGLASLLFLLMKNQDFDKYIIKETNDFEEKKKKKIIIDEVKTGRESGKIFYIISQHGDCAKDHLDYQGKIYVDEKWRNYVEKEDMKEIAHFIRMNNIKTFQWVIGKPVWLITRPNCRHYFEKVSPKEVLADPTYNILNKRNMIKSEGNRDLFQTKRLKTAKENYEYYKQRCETHKKMYEEQKNPELLKAIQKDKLLMKKWKEVIDNIEKYVV